MNSIILWSCISRIVLDCILTFLVCLLKRKKRNKYYFRRFHMEQTKLEREVNAFNSRLSAKHKPHKWYIKMSTAIDKLMAKVVSAKCNDEEFIDLIDHNIICACLNALTEFGSNRGDTIIYTEILKLYEKEAESYEQRI